MKSHSTKSWRSLALVVAVFTVPVLLFLPVFYYSLHTPFSLADDYGMFRTPFYHFDSLAQFRHWIETRFLAPYLGEVPTVHHRYRPFWEFYNMVTWKVFGPTPWLHHLARWVMHFGAVCTFASAFLCFARYRQTGHAMLSRFLRLLPLALLVNLWLFFPNQPAARLGPQEVYTVFFLGLCNWMMALVLLQDDRPTRRGQPLLIYGVFCLAYGGLAWSKEVNLAALLWILVFYCVLILQRASRWQLLGGLPLVLIFAHTLRRVYVVRQATAYGSADLTPELLVVNGTWLVEQLFQVDTSLLITAGLTLLWALVLLFTMRKAVRRQFSPEFGFVLFLLGQFVSLFCILCTSWAQILRYWYILIPVFSMLLAFSAKSMLEFTHDWSAKQPDRMRLASPSMLVACALTIFMEFFVICNYYNFLSQILVEHRARHTDATILATIAHLHDQGHYILVGRDDPGQEPFSLIDLYCRRFLPQYYDRVCKIYTAPPAEASYYTADILRSWQPNLRTSYSLLAYAYKVADIFQTGKPYQRLDSGLNDISWHIYDNRELNSSLINVLDVDKLIAEAGAPVIRAVYDVYYHYNDNRLIYVKHPCSPDDIAPFFLLHLQPVYHNDLPYWRKQYGFDNHDFAFKTHGVRVDDRCLVVIEPPAYAISQIRTGQYISGQDPIWEAAFDLDG